jgi:hypothetical protein
MADRARHDALILARLRLGANLRRALRLAMCGDVPAARQVIEDSAADLDEIERLTGQATLPVRENSSERSGDG